VCYSCCCRRVFSSIIFFTVVVVNVIIVVVVVVVVVIVIVIILFKGSRRVVVIKSTTKTKKLLGRWFSTDEGVVYYNEDPKFPNNCGDDYCASDSEWKDGCAKCLCYEKGNRSWCDGTNNAHYDNYFDQNRVNPWGDRNRENRKCNQVFPSLYDPWFGNPKTKENICHHDWQCASGLKCLSVWEDGKSSYCVELPQEEGKAGEIAVGKTCDPHLPNRCKNENCAGVAGNEGEDGCAACMCYKKGNHARCDGTRNEYYDKYFDEHDENPYGFKEEEKQV